MENPILNFKMKKSRDWFREVVEGVWSRERERIVGEF